jgi:hypothetical protein
MLNIHKDEWSRSVGTLGCSGKERRAEEPKIGALAY